jgi:hypothetical protein
MTAEIKDTTNWRVPEHPLLELWTSVTLPCRILFLLAIGLYFYAHHRSIRLPGSSTLLPINQQPPVQTTTSTPSFLFDWRGKSFVIYPQAEYQAQGLLLTHNNTGGIGDIYHDSDSVDLKDICIVWGESATSGSYLHGTFHSEPWTCVYSAKAERDLIYDDEFSNNHLLAGTKAIEEKIRAARIGDQVKFSGFLVNYAPAENPELLRRSSLVRDDTGDGACEVVFVTSFEILVRANTSWRRWEKISWYTMISFGSFTLISLLLLPYLEYRWE